jgi:hypothetical protein
MLQAIWLSEREQICLATYVMRIAVSEQASDQSFVWIYFFSAVNVDKTCRSKYVNRALFNWNIILFRES